MPLASASATESSRQSARAADGHAGVGGDGAAAGAALHGGKVALCRAVHSRVRSSGGGPFKGGRRIHRQFPAPARPAPARWPVSRGTPSAAWVLRAGSALLWALTARTEAASISSQRAIGMPIWMMEMVVRSRLDAGNEQVAADTASGRGERGDFGHHAQRALAAHHQARQVVARAALRARVPVRMTLPWAVTTSSASTLSRMVP